jgi:hypothetical protein
MSSKFSLGAVVATPAALELLANHNENPATFLARHQAGDFGDLDPHDVRTQNAALKAEAKDAEAAQRMISSYTLGDGERLWIITEWDRSVTTLLLPNEY